MRLALSLIFVLVCLGVLFRAFFSEIRPFGIVKAAIAHLPSFVRDQPLVAAFLFIPFAAAPLGSVASSMAGEHWAVRAIASLMWQGLCTGLLALAAVRIHRRIIFREKPNRILFGRRERRMAGYVVGALILIALVRLVPPFSGTVLGNAGLPQSMLQVSAFAVSWTLVVAFAFVGPSASFDDASPFAVSVASVRKEPLASIALVLFAQIVLAVTSLAMTSFVLLGQLNTVLVVIVALAALTAMAATFIVAELSIAIALTRIRENVYDDTRSREHNADWH